MFQIRFHTKYEVKNGLSKFVDKYCSRCLGMVHKQGQDNEHVHLVIHTTYVVSTLRKNFRSMVIGGHGNKAYSIKTCNDGMLSYICKENPPKKYILKGYTDNDIKMFHKMSDSHNDRLKKNNNNKANPYFIQLFKRLKDNPKLKKQCLEWCHKKEHNKTSKFLQKVVIKFYIKDTKTFPNKYQVSNVSNSLMARLLIEYGILTDQVCEIMHAIIYEDPCLLEADPVNEQILNYIN